MGSTDPRYPPPHRAVTALKLIEKGPEAVKAFIDALPDDVIDFYRDPRGSYTVWDFYARDEQLSPQGDWVTWFYCGGRGTGKTRTGAEWVLQKVREGAKIIHLIAPTEADYRDVMIKGPAGFMSISPPGERPRVSDGGRNLIFPNGARAICFSAEQPERLRGPQCEFAWCDEIAAWRNPQATWDMMSFGLRLGRKPQVMVSSTPKPIPLVKQLLADPTTAVTRGSSLDNKANLAPTFFDKITKRYEGTRLGRQELNAELLTDNPGALWNFSQLDALRVKPDRDRKFNRIVVAVDPPVTSGEDADECGIIVAGLGEDKHGYIIGDATTRGDTPAEWAKKALIAYRTNGATAMVVEVNQGGLMVEDVIRNANKALPYPVPGLKIVQVRAFQGKYLRAEPVSALYEQGQVHHCGTFGTLEDQMTNYTIDSPRKPSPDRMDAMVYAITDLMLRHIETSSQALMGTY